MADWRPNGAPPIPTTERDGSSCNRFDLPLALRHPDRPDLFVLDRELTIGRAPDNGLVIADSHVSGHHCVIRRTHAGFVVSDCGSTNGTYLGGHPIVSAVLTPGAPLRLGGTVLVVVDAGKLAADTMLGTSPAMASLRGLIARAAPHTCPVHLRGESGTGKELAARAIHEASGRTGPFVAFNCASFSRELAESQLFGHERGAFTGAVERHIGVFEAAHLGTLFLDEIAELPDAVQAKLLRVLEDFRIHPIGSRAERRVDVRLVTATHKDLATLAARGHFRADLLYRLHTIDIHIPPLRDRRSDIVDLAQHFLALMRRDVGFRSFTPEARQALIEYHWPGNIRQLRAAVQKAAILDDRPLIGPELLIPRDATSEELSQTITKLEGKGLDDIIRDALQTALARCEFNIRAAARMLRRPHSSFRRDLIRYGLMPALPHRPNARCRPDAAPAAAESQPHTERHYVEPDSFTDPDSFDSAA